MKTLLLVLGGVVVGDKPGAHFLLRIEAALEYYSQHREEDVIFFVSGRWKNATDNFNTTESEIGKRYILEKIPDALVYKEDISVDLIGNYAFSRPLIELLQPDKIVVFTSDLLLERNRKIARKIFGSEDRFDFRIITHDLSDNKNLVAKEKNAVKLLENLFREIRDGDDSGVRDTLLYKTPYYFKGIVDDKAYFDKYWEGGYDQYIYMLNTEARSKK